MNIANRIEFLRLCMQRMEDGADEHGRSDPRTEKRNMPTEALAEAADLSNYMGMFQDIVLLDASLNADDVNELIEHAQEIQREAYPVGIACIRLRDKYRSMKEAGGKKDVR
jgi:hypothetical protein